MRRTTRWVHYSHLSACSLQHNKACSGLTNRQLLLNL